MNFCKRYFCLLLTVGWLLVTGVAVSAAPPPLKTPAGLAFAEVQITGDEFIILQNNSLMAISDLSVYWLHYFNKTDPHSSGAKGSVVQLPASVLGPGQTVLLSTIGRPTCGASISDSLSITLADSGGFLEVMELTVGPSGAINETAGDLVSWNSGTTGIIQKVASASGTNPQPVWYRYQNSTVPISTYSWQKASIDSTNPCQLAVVTTTSPPAPVLSPSLILSTAYPPGRIISLNSPAATDGDSKTLPVADIGLLAPQLSELLPNPKSPQTDAQDEFVEIYNPNDKVFDLSGFGLQVGTTTIHKFMFGNGTLLKPKSFTIFTSANTHLSMTNSSGQAKLLDPASKIISQTDIYETAKDGQSWAQAEGRWYWTVKPTPGAVNAVDQSIATTTSNNGPTPSGSVAGASTYSTNLGTKPALGSSPSKGSPLHPAVLAGIGILAVSYGLYEYRHDLANTHHRFQRYRKARRAARAPDKKSPSRRATLRLGWWQNNLRSRLSQRLRLLRRYRKPDLHA